MNTYFILRGREDSGSSAVAACLTNFFSLEKKNCEIGNEKKTVKQTATAEDLGQEGVIQILYVKRYAFVFNFS